MPRHLDRTRTVEWSTVALTVAMVAVALLVLLVLIGW
jgi:hypothetical protein